MSEPRWLIGGDAVLAAAADVPTVWLVSIDDPSARTRAASVAMSASELADVAAYVDAGERLLRRRLAKLILAAAGDCHTGAVVIERRASGAPVVTTPARWHISLAARWPDCAIGVAPRPLGVDIERADVEPLPFDLLTEAERGQGHATACWAAKEAHAKWTGRPRELDPAKIETGQPPMVTSRFGATTCWLRDEGEYIAAICTA